MADNPFDQFDQPGPSPGSVASPNPTAPITGAGNPFDRFDTHQAAIPTEVVKPQGKPPGYLQSFGEGLMTPVYGAAQLAEHILPISELAHDIGVPGAKSTAQIDKEMRERAASLSKEGQGKFNLTRAAGEIASPINYMGYGYLSDLMGLGKFSESVLSGMLGAAAQPVTTDKNYWAEKGKQTAEGAAAGAVLGAVGSRLSKPNPDKELLKQHGIRMTPGELTDMSLVRRAEEAARSFPIVGTVIRRAEDTGVKDYNRAIYDMALAPIGQKYKGGDLVGTEGVKKVEEQIGDAYDRVLPHVHFRADQNLANDFHRLSSLVRQMPPDQVNQFNNIATERVIRRLQPTGTMDGETFKQLQSELTYMAGGMHASGDAAQRHLGDAIDELNDMLRRNLSRQNPKYAADIEDANRASSMYARIRRAATNRPTSSGIFTPADMLSALRSLDRTPGHGQFARGLAPMQPLSTSAQEIMGKRLADSGTPERQFWRRLLEYPPAGMVEAGVGAGAYGWGHLPAAAGLAGLSLMYTKPALTIMNNTPIMQYLGYTAPPLAAAAGATLGMQK